MGISFIGHSLSLRGCGGWRIGYVGGIAQEQRRDNRHVQDPADSRPPSITMTMGWDAFESSHSTPKGGSPVAAAGPLP